MLNGNPMVTATVIYKGTDSDGNTLTIQKIVTTKRGKRLPTGKYTKVPMKTTYNVVVAVPNKPELVTEHATLGAARETANVNYAPPVKETRPTSDYAEQQRGYSRPR